MSHDLETIHRNLIMHGAVLIDSSPANHRIYRSPDGRFFPLIKPSGECYTDNQINTIADSLLEVGIEIRPINQHI